MSVSVVVDASLLVAALVDGGDDGRWAEGILASGTLIAPQLAPVETSNVLRRLELSRKLDRLEASHAMRDLLAMDLQLVPYMPFAERVWSLRAGMRCYDAWYVAVAEAFGAPLATLDRRLAAAPGSLCRFLLPDPH
jgi:predicted nucleic acid-binding protein